MNPMPFIFTNGSSALTLFAAGLPEAAVKAEEMVSHPHLWKFEAAGMTLGRFLEDAREMMGVK